MKKLFKVLLVGLITFSLVACGSTDKPAEGGGDKPVKVALLVQMLGDLSFNDSAKVGVDKAAADLGMDVKIIEYGTDVSKEESSLIDAADSGYDIIIAPSNFADYYEQHAKEYPDTTFILFDATVDYDANGDDVKNVYSIVYSANEASFAAGYLAAKKSETGVIGFLGGQEAPVINDFLVGYIEGAKLANPDIKVAVSFVGNWTDSAKGKELTLAMNNQKADVVFAAAGGAGMGIFEAAIEKGTQSIGVDFDQATVFAEQGKDDFANVTMTSVLKNVGDSLFRALELYQKGELKVGQAETLGIKENGVGLADNKFYEAAVSEEIRKDVADFIKKIADGEVEVTSFYGMETSTFTELKNSVRP
ncbi:BMP family ABC transporter substrate-binding protein [Erysipelothrix sp. HDW6C]|uniref:BMP family ABC transporter substrate-binding protein n=1 Tax=Erysipelothrix sp. HDW6C TaxID=2714930 RepID=UPI00140873D0|nr:BMP family ABC transporter substrate-binding protein [Erysipelothrix sp. HDW6C]QIK69630.1 BMP family ABC transporter substrate-binding protein [Erysipelothrix sp. HDW6C]